MDGASIPGPWLFRNVNAECLEVLAAWNRNSIVDLLAQANVREANHFYFNG